MLTRRLRRDKPKWTDIANVIILFFAFVAAAAAAVEAYHLARLTREAIDTADVAAKKQREVAIDTEQRQLRAYVFLRDVRFAKRNDSNYDIIPEWENSGGSQTKDMTAHLSFYAAKEDLTEWFPYGDIKLNTTTAPILLGPKSISNNSFGSINKACLSQFNRRDEVTKFYVWGWAKYDDVLTTVHHITRFCWDVSDIVFAPDGQIARLSHQLCARGNCADDNCPNSPEESYKVFVLPCKPEP
jgi:hypothetical protein